MIQAFKRSRIASAVVMVLSVFIAVLIWIRDRDYEIIVPIIASVLMLGIGFFAARLLGNILASMENTRYLGYLHMELDPPKFLEAYASIPGRLEPGSSNAVICASYLADGYAANGEFDKAIEVLGPEPEAAELSVRGLHASKLAACCLGKGDIEGTRQALEALSGIIDACRLSKAELAQNLEESLKLCRCGLNCLEGKKVDADWLGAAFDRAQYNIRRLEIAKIQAMTALRDGDRSEAKSRLTYLRQNSGKTCFKKWADREGQAAGL